MRIQRPVQRGTARLPAGTRKMAQRLQLRHCSALPGLIYSASQWANEVWPGAMLPGTAAWLAVPAAAH